MKQTIKITESKQIPMTDIESNKGQITGVPANPRNVRNARFRLLVNSLREMPEMMGMRELLVYPVTRMGG